MTSNGLNGDSSLPSGDLPQIDQVKKAGFFDSVLAPPDWFTQSFMENVLQNDQKDNQLKITKYAIAPCTKPGDNFVGVIFRATVTYNTHDEDRNESFIVKVEPFLEGYKKDIMANQPFFETEGRMYKEVLPVMQEMLKNIGDDEIIAPRLIHCGVNPNILIFQDLAPDGFVMQHRAVGFEQSKSIAAKLGKFHALSFYMDKEQPDGLCTTFKDGFFSAELTANWDFVDLNFNVLCEQIKNWGPEMILVADKMTAFKPVFIQKLQEIFLPKAGGINVLNHGDHHIRNLLFRYDSNDSTKYDAIRCIDYQLSVYSTPAIDLAYLMFMIADRECRQNHRDQLLKSYHDQFVATLNQLGCKAKPPTLLDIQVETLKNGLMEFFLATNFLSMFYMDFTQMADLDFSDKTQMPVYIRIMFENEELKSLLMHLLPELMYKGILDA